MLATVAQLKTWLGIAASDTGQDALLTAILEGLTAQADVITGRTLLVTDEAVTEYYTGGSEYLMLRRYPVVAITSIKLGYDWVFDTAEALVANTDYRLVDGGRRGIVWRAYGKWPERPPEAIQVVYRGGYCAAGETAGEGETALPDDLREAIIHQASYWYKNKDKLGLASVSFDGGGASSYAQAELLKDVRLTLEMYRRPQL